MMQLSARTPDMTTADDDTERGSIPANWMDTFLANSEKEKREAEARRAQRKREQEQARRARKKAKRAERSDPPADDPPTDAPPPQADPVMTAAGDPANLQVTTTEPVVVSATIATPPLVH